MSSLEKIANQFRINGEIITISNWGGGHINDTFRVQCNSGMDYILQKVNTQIFTQPDELMQNILAVTKHIHRKIEPTDLVIELIISKDGDFWINNNFGVWRMYPFLEGKSSNDVTNSDEVCYKVGKTYGAFLVALDDFPVNQLHITIPKFHDIRYRLEQFDRAVEQSKEEKIKIAKNEIEHIHSKVEFYLNLYQLAETILPLRVTHNDTKLNNVLIGEDHLGTVIDLDTAMPGYSFFDVGDALRSIAISAKEDDPNIDVIELSSLKKEAFLKGYLDSAYDVLTHHEIDFFNQSGAYMAYIMAIRFLTDFLCSNFYYKTEYSNHNLVRAKNQLRVCELFLNH